MAQEMGAPSGLDDPPPSIIGLEWVLQGFLELDARRKTNIIPTGLGKPILQPEPIPMQEIESYCRRQLLDDDVARDFEYFVVNHLDPTRMDMLRRSS